ncbi:MAG: hypothetical protein HUJ22_04645 [Gracilimonas sp.]|uniref:hypothetical protein n=1 Tax=Gracilimonas sp. TaxID=1974203 RepID=UPI0019CC1848|nr:hypothetical protein [Gracilimonas sp.]MBD3615841.1 hypothetical protein [Gracilimonas sp.]
MSGGETFDELRAKIKKCVDDPSGVLRELDKAEIIAIARDQYLQTGMKLPKDLKQELSEYYYFSDKAIEKLVYDNVIDQEAKNGCKIE